MATKKPRVNVVLEPDLYRDLGYYARRDRLSMSKMINQLVKQAIENLEDYEMSKVFDRRMKTFDRRKALKHEDVFKF